MANEKHLLLTAQGDWNDSALSAEVWQVGIRLALVFGAVDPVGTLPNNWDPQANEINRTETNWTITGNWNVDTGLHTFNPDDYLNDQATDAFAAWMGVMPAMWNKCRLRTLKLSPIGTDGKAIPAPPYSTGTPCLLTYTASNPIGGNSSNPLPLENAIVASHRTGQIGKPGRGRMFIPGFTTSIVDTHGEISSSNSTDIAAAQVALLEALAYTDGAPPAAHVRPIVTGGNFTKYGVISQVRVGNVIDTQRRRRNQLAETYVSDSPTY